MSFPAHSFINQIIIDTEYSERHRCSMKERLISSSFPSYISSCIIYLTTHNYLVVFLCYCRWEGTTVVASRLSLN